MSYLVKAIRSLKPGSEFAFQNDDYLTIEWHVLDGDAPTAKAIADEITKIKTDEANAAKSKADAKAALLERLGITSDEAALLLL